MASAILPLTIEGYFSGPRVKTLQIFKAGIHTDTSGDTRQYAEAEIDRTAKAYKPSLHEAPLTIGHPKNNDPAYGWVSRLVANAGSLEASPRQVDPAFSEMVKLGRFKKISASFYNPNSPLNPVPGIYYLRHVGFLGAQPPAVKGLKEVAFAEEEEGVTTVEFAEEEMLPTGNTGDELSELIAKLQERVAALEAQVNPTEEPPEETTDMSERSADLEKREAALAARELILQKSELSNFLEGLAKEGKILPREKALHLEIMSALPIAEIEFGEGDDKAKLPALEAYKKSLEDRPKLIEYGEVAGGAVITDTIEKPEGIAKKAVNYQEEQRAKGITVNTIEAVKHVMGAAK